MNNLRLKIILCNVLFLFLFSCLKQNSNVLNISNTQNYLLVQRGDAEERDDGTFSTQERTALKHFFYDKRFKLNYHIGLPERKSVDELKRDSAPGKRELMSEITKIASKLEANSTLVYHYTAHGNDNGTWVSGSNDDFARAMSTGEDDEIVYPKNILDALNDGLKSNSNTKTFKRFVIIGDSCNGEAFMLRLKEEEKNYKIFKEGIYIAAAYSGFNAAAEVESYIYLPILFFLRAQQITSCSGKSDSFQTTYNTVVEPFLKEMDLSQEAIDCTLKVISLDKLIRSTSFNEKNPTFNDLDLIFEKIKDNSSEIRGLCYNRYKRGIPVEITLNISFSDESLRNESIFPSIVGCN